MVSSRQIRKMGVELAARYADGYTIVEVHEFFKTYTGSKVGFSQFDRILRAIRASDGGAPASVTSGKDAEATTNKKGGAVQNVALKPADGIYKTLLQAQKNMPKPRSYDPEKTKLESQRLIAETQAKMDAAKKS